MVQFYRKGISQIKITAALLTLFTLFLSNAFAQRSTQRRLIEDVIARLGHGTIHEIQYAPNSTQVAVASSTGIWLCDIGFQKVGNDWRSERIPLIETDWVFTVSFNPDGKTLASGSWNKVVQLYDAVTGEPKGTLKGHTSDVASVAFSRDGSVIAGGSGDKTVRLWNAETGESKGVFTGHTESVFDVAFSPDGKILASGSRDGTVLLWQVAD